MEPNLHPNPAGTLVERCRDEIKKCQDILGNKTIDVYMPARLDTKASVEEVVGELKKLQDEGLFTELGLSEVKGSTLERANKVRPQTLPYFRNLSTWYIPPADMYRSRPSPFSKSKFLFGHTTKTSKVPSLPPNRSVFRFSPTPLLVEASSLVNGLIPRISLKDLISVTHPDSKAMLSIRTSNWSTCSMRRPRRREWRLVNWLWDGLWD